MDGFYSKIHDVEYHAAAFFAVCRGKVGTWVLTFFCWRHCLVGDARPRAGASWHFESGLCKAVLW